MQSNRLKELRNAQRLSQTELAVKIGASKQSISNWENDNIQPSIDVLKKLALFFGVTSDYLLGIEKNMNSLDAESLTSDEIQHIQQIIDDIRRSR